MLEARQNASGAKLTELRVDGGATASDLQMQLQADVNSTAAGAGYDFFGGSLASESYR